MPPLSDNEILEFRQSSNWHLSQEMEKLRKEFQIDAYPQFDWHPWRGEVVFSKGGVPKVVARLQVAGALSAGKIASWTWAWANPALPPSVKEAALRARKFGEEKGVLALMQSRWAANEAEAWTMTAIACRLIDGRGGLKSPGKDATTYLVLGEVRAVGDRARVFGAKSCAHVLDGERPILLLSRESDGETLALCGGDDDSPSALRDVKLDALLNLDPSLEELADLPDGWAAVREGADEPWVRSRSG